MYYPYLRGRQNELICLRELLDNELLSEKIVPIIEPVKCNSTFFSTLSKFIKSNREIIIIGNPQVGSFKKEYVGLKEELNNRISIDNDSKNLLTIEEYEKNIHDDHVLPAYILTPKIYADIVKGAKEVRDKIIINQNKQTYQYYDNHSELLASRLTLIPKGDEFEDVVNGDIVVIDDCFNKAKKNSDYIDIPDELFSRTHLKFLKRGYVGFSDYSIIGKDFEESGFAPLAIAIHIVYFNEKNELRVHHFVSDSNNSIQDPARKFQEAMEKLLSWDLLEMVPQTLGLNTLISYYNNGKFPGLGVIKKCSLMHHMEIMGDYLGAMNV